MGKIKIEVRAHYDAANLKQIAEMDEFDLQINESEYTQDYLSHVLSIMRANIKTEAALSGKFSVSINNSEFVIAENLTDAAIKILKKQGKIGVPERKPSIFAAIDDAFEEKRILDGIAAQKENICYHCDKPTGEKDWVTEVSPMKKTYKRVHRQCSINAIELGLEEED